MILNAKIHTTSDKLCSFELCPVICQNSFGHIESVFDALRNLTAASWVVFTVGTTFIYLVNMSISMNKYLKPLGALGKMPTMSIPQTVKGQEISIGRRGLPCFIICFWKN
jgi:hypothetical protein